MERPDDGFALPAVLIFLLVVAAIVGPFAMAARRTLDASGHRIDRLALDLEAEGYIRLFTARAGEIAASAGQGSLAGRTVGCRIRDRRIVARLQDQAGLVDLNGAGRLLLEKGFEAVGLDRDTAARMSGEVEAARRREPSVSSGAVERDLSVRHAPFEAPIELTEFRSLAGLKREVLEGIFTVHTRSGSIVADKVPNALSGRLGDRLDGVIVTRAPTSAIVAVDVMVASGRSLGRAGAVVRRGPDGRLDILEHRDGRRAGLFADDSVAWIDCRVLLGILSSDEELEP